LTAEQIADGGGRTDRRGGARKSAREHVVDAGLELYGANGCFVHLFWPCLLEAVEAFAQAGRLIRDVV
jgi:hypothetical protein